MITSAMFYRTADNVERPMSITLGPLTFSIQELFVSLISVAIVVPVNLIIIELFRRTNDLNMFGALERIQARRAEKRQTQVQQFNEKLVKTDFGKKLKAAGVTEIELGPVSNSNKMDIVDIEDIDEEYVSDKKEKREEEGKKKKMKMLPSWMRIIAWLLLALAILVPAFFVILYSMEWGAEKANQWLVSFVLSILEDVFLINPLKVGMIVY